MAQATKSKILRRLAAWANLLWLLTLPLILHGFVYVDRHPQEAPVLWKMKSEIEVTITALLPMDIAAIRPYYVGVLIIIVTIVYLLQLSTALAFSSLRSFSRIGVLALGLIVLLAPVSLGRTGVCAYEFHRASADDILGRAIAMGVKNGDLDPAIANAADYFQLHNRKTCCHLTPRKRGFLSFSDVFEEISVGRIFDVVYEGDAKQLRASVEMCGRSTPSK
jgi:hypothetical protein